MTILASDSPGNFLLGEMCTFRNIHVFLTNINKFRKGCSLVRNGNCQKIDLSYLDSHAEVQGDGGVGLTLGGAHRVKVAIVALVRTKSVFLSARHEDSFRNKSLSISAQRLP